MIEDGAASQRSQTARNRSNSNKANLQRRLAEFIEHSPSIAEWSPTGFRPDLGLLSGILALTDPTDVRGGSVATGLDMWAAATLRGAGLTNVRPQRHEPFYVGRLGSEVQSQFLQIDKALEALSRVTTDSSLSQPLKSKINMARRTIATQLKRMRVEIERSTTKVLGESRSKQVDVFAAEWDRGLELLISTKTFALAADVGELVKNLPNRWEEFDGDLKNLRGRYPLAVIGALTVLPKVALEGGALKAFVDMMTKLTAPGRPWVNAYDRTTIIIADWENVSTEGVPILNNMLSPTELPTDLQPEGFFDFLLEKLLERAPVTEHTEARKAAAIARGEDPSVIDRAAAELEQAEDMQETIV